VSEHQGACFAIWSHSESQLDGPGNQAPLFSRISNLCEVVVMSVISWVILARGADNDTTDLHLGRLSDDMADGFGNVIGGQQRSELLMKGLHRYRMWCRF
jgi:hypothetical protein